MDQWVEIRRRVLTRELSKRAACKEYKIEWRTLQRILTHEEPAGYQMKEPRQKRKLERFLPIIHEILQQDQQAPKKQRHTAQRIFDRLRDEHQYDGGLTIVKDSVRTWKGRQAEVFVPLAHRSGEAQVDFGEAQVSLRGEQVTVAMFVMTLPYSDAIFCQVFPHECTETFQEGHKRAFSFFGGVPRRISYDNSKIAVRKLTGVHARQLTTEFLRLQGHFAFACHFCGVRHPQEKGHVENGVGYVRRNFLVPVPQVDCWEEANTKLAQACQREFARPGADRRHTTAELLAADRAAFLALPAEPFEARRVELVRINALSLGRFDGNDYSVPTAYAYQSLSATGGIDCVRFRHRGKVVAEHARCWGKAQVRFEPLHYLALLERKPGALDHARPLAGWTLPEAFGQLRRRLEEKDPHEGTRQYIRVLRLLETHERAAVTTAVEQALKLAVVDPDGVRLLLQCALEQPAAPFDLTGRPALQSIRLPAPKLADYNALTSRKEVK